MLNHRDLKGCRAKRRRGVGWQPCCKGGHVDLTNFRATAKVNEGWAWVSLRTQMSDLIYISITTTYGL